jgi:preprotein translocase subunit SecA
VHVQALTKGFHYAIIDEADSLLIDDCRNPLVISNSLEDDCAAEERFKLAHEVRRSTRAIMLPLQQDRKP